MGGANLNNQPQICRIYIYIYNSIDLSPAKQTDLDEMSFFSHFIYLRNLIFHHFKEFHFLFFHLKWIRGKFTLSNDLVNDVVLILQFQYVHLHLHTKPL